MPREKTAKSKWGYAVGWLVGLVRDYGDVWSSDADYRAQEEWARHYEPEATKPYEQAHDYAVWRYTLAQEHWDALDKKADDIIRYAGLVMGAIGTLATTVAARLWEAQHVSVLWLLPCFVVAAMSFLLALLAQKPTPLPIPGSGREVLGFVVDPRISDEGQVRALIAAALHAATAGLQAAVSEKARRVNVATVALLMGLLLLALPLLLATG